MAPRRTSDKGAPIFYCKASGGICLSCVAAIFKKSMSIPAALRLAVFPVIFFGALLIFTALLPYNIPFWWRPFFPTFGLAFAAMRLQSDGTIMSFRKLVKWQDAPTSSASFCVADWLSYFNEFRFSASSVVAISRAAAFFTPKKFAVWLSAVFAKHFKRQIASAFCANFCHEVKYTVVVFAWQGAM